MGFLRACFQADDCLAVVLIDRRSGKVVQSIGSRESISRKSAFAVANRLNAIGYDVFVSVNPLMPGARSRSVTHIGSIRRLFVDLDQREAMASLSRNRGLPRPTVVLRTSPNRWHALWNVTGFGVSSAQQTQRWLASEVGGDAAATSAAQLTRLPGFWNHKYRKPYLVWVEYRDLDRVYTPLDFPSVERVEPARREPAVAMRGVRGATSPFERAVAYLAKVPAAIAGHHGDLRTFQTCCRIVRGFALDDDQALAVLADWNARCQPPWTERELLHKIRSARRNGREPIGGLL